MLKVISLISGGLRIPLGLAGLDAYDLPLKILGTTV